ncbi:MAG TPA: hypothetical protein VM580_03730, partial [Labilithrix sp.]|nr:hypothetical protein [Labilithrix sp.]
MTSGWMLRAAAAPGRFLDGGFARLLARQGMARHSKTRSRSRTTVELGVALPADLARFMNVIGDGSVADFVARPTLPSFASLLASARRGGAPFARLTALLACAVPFGETRKREVVAYFLADPP